jgi:hypothetical protein
MRQATQTTQNVIAGTRPVGSCPADGSHKWAVHYLEDNVHHFIVFDGWLQASETTTTDIEIAELVEQSLVGEIDNRWT